MVGARATVISVCVAAILLHTSGFVSARYFPIFDKFAALAQIKYPTTSPPPTDINPIATVYIPAYPAYPTSTNIGTPTGLTDILTDNPNTDTVTTPMLDIDIDTNTPIITVTNSSTNLPTDINTVAPVAAPLTTITRSFDPLKANPDDEDDEIIENEIRYLEEYLLAEGRASAALRRRQQQQTRKQESSENKRSRQEQKRRRQKPRQQQRRCQNNQSKRQRNEVQRLRHIVRQLLVREQIQNGNETPVRILVRQSQNGRGYPKRGSQVRRMENSD